MYMYVTGCSVVSYHNHILWRVFECRDKDCMAGQNVRLSLIIIFLLILSVVLLYRGQWSLSDCAPEQEPVVVIKLVFIRLPLSRSLGQTK